MSSYIYFTIDDKGTVIDGYSRNSRLYQEVEERIGLTNEGEECNTNVLQNVINELQVEIEAIKVGLMIRLFNINDTDEDVRDIKFMFDDIRELIEVIAVLKLVIWNAENHKIKIWAG